MKEIGILLPSSQLPDKMGKSWKLLARKFWSACESEGLAGSAGLSLHTSTGQEFAHGSVHTRPHASWCLTRSGHEQQRRTGLCCPLLPFSSCYAQASATAEPSASLWLRPSPFEAQCHNTRDILRAAPF